MSSNGSGTGATIAGKYTKAPARDHPSAPIANQKMWQRLRKMGGNREQEFRESI
jgi:hypothetical protein